MPRTKEQQKQIDELNEQINKSLSKRDEDMETIEKLRKQLKQLGEERRKARAAKEAAEKVEAAKVNSIPKQFEPLNEASIEANDTKEVAVKPEQEAFQPFQAKEAENENSFDTNAQQPSQETVVVIAPNHAANKPVAPNRTSASQILKWIGIGLAVTVGVALIVFGGLELAGIASLGLFGIAAAVTTAQAVSLMLGGIIALATTAATLYIDAKRNKVAPAPSLPSLDNKQHTNTESYGITADHQSSKVPALHPALTPLLEKNDGNPAIQPDKTLANQEETTSNNQVVKINLTIEAQTEENSEVQSFSATP